MGGKEGEGRKKKMKFVPPLALQLSSVTGVSGRSLKDPETVRSILMTTNGTFYAAEFKQSLPFSRSRSYQHVKIKPIR